MDGNAKSMNVLPTPRRTLSYFFWSHGRKSMRTGVKTILNTKRFVPGLASGCPKFKGGFDEKHV